MIVYFNYKSDLDDDFKSATYNLKTNEIIESSVEHISSTRSTYIPCNYSH